MKINKRILAIIMMVCITLTLQTTYASTKKMSSKQKVAYQNKVHALLKKEKKSSKEIGFDAWEDPSVSYVYFDINKDGIKELVVKGHCIGTNVYTYKKGKVKRIGQGGDGACSSYCMYNEKYFVICVEGELRLYKRRSSNYDYDNAISVGWADGNFGTTVCHDSISNCIKYKICNKKGTIIMKQFNWKQNEFTQKNKI